MATRGEGSSVDRGLVSGLAGGGGRARDGHSAWTRRAKSRRVGSAMSCANAGPSGSQSGSVALAASTSTSPPSTGLSGPRSKYSATNSRTSSSVIGRPSRSERARHARRTSSASNGALMAVSTKSLESGHIPARCTAASSSPPQYTSAKEARVDSSPSFIAPAPPARGGLPHRHSAHPIQVSEVIKFS